MGRSWGTTGKQVPDVSDQWQGKKLFGTLLAPQPTSPPETQSCGANWGSEMWTMHWPGALLHWKQENPSVRRAHVSALGFNGLLTVCYDHLIQHHKQILRGNWHSKTQPYADASSGNSNANRQLWFKGNNRRTASHPTGISNFLAWKHMREPLADSTQLYILVLLNTVSKRFGPLQMPIICSIIIRSTLRT